MACCPTTGVTPVTPAPVTPATPAPVTPALEERDASSMALSPCSVEGPGEVSDLTTDMENTLSLAEQPPSASIPRSQEDNRSSPDTEPSSTNPSSKIQNADGTDVSVSSSITADTDKESQAGLINKCEVETSENPSEDDNCGGITIVDLPTEVFLQVCSYLDVRFLLRTLRLVCRRFYFILSDGFVWRSRIVRSWTQIYPPIPPQDEDNFDWADACLHLEDQKNLWSNKEQTMLHTSWQDAHYSCVDSVLLINGGRMCVSGSRDHSLALWDVETFQHTPITRREGHKGWVWRLTPDSETSFYSCSFDNKVKHWSLEPDLRETASFDCKTPVISIASAPDFIATAFQNSEVWLFDCRADITPVHKYSVNKGYALSLGIICDNGSSDFIVSAGNRGYVSVWDIRAGKMLINSQQVCSKPNLKCTMLSMSLRKDLCYLGDSLGRLHLMDPRKDSETAFEILATYNLRHHKIYAVCGGKGSLLCGGSDGRVRIFAPTHELELITEFEYDLKAEVTCMDYRHNILIIGSSNSSVGVYKPVS